MTRLEHAAVAVVLLLAFVADLRLVVPAVAIAVGVALARRRGGRAVIADVALLAAASVAFLLDAEVAAWATALAAAVVSGMRAVTAGGAWLPARRSREV